MRPTSCASTSTAAGSRGAAAAAATSPGVLLDQIKFIRISMLTDPALDAGRHEFELRTLLGRVLPPEENLKHVRENGWIPPVREIYPLMIGGMSFGALSPNMWEGLQMGVAYLNEELGMPVRMCTGEGGCPPRLLRSRFLKYVILQIASGYFGWDEIIHALPEMKEDPCAIEIKYGQGAKPGDGGLLMWYKVNKLIAAIRGVPPGVSLPSPPTHQTQYSIEESVAKMIQSMSMAWGFRVPVYPKISGTSTALAVLNNLTRNPYAAGLAIDGEDGGTGAAYNVSMNHMGHPIASNIRDCYLTLVKLGKQNELPIFAGGGIGKSGNLAANAAALIMLGASGGAGRQVHHAGRRGVPGIGIRPVQHLQHRALPQGHHVPGPAPLPAPERRQGRRAGGGRLRELRHRTEEDRGPARPLDVAAHRHVRRARGGGSPHGRAVEHQARGVTTRRVDTDHP